MSNSLNLYGKINNMVDMQYTETVKNFNYRLLCNLQLKFLTVIISMIILETSGSYL